MRTFIPNTFIQNLFDTGRMISIRQTKSNVAQNMARSLPVSVPLPEGLPTRGEIFDIPSDEEEDENDIEGKYIQFL